MLGLFRAVLNTILLCCAVLLHLKLFIPSINSFQYPTNGVSISNAAFKLSFAREIPAVRARSARSLARQKTMLKGEWDLHVL